MSSDSCKDSLKILLLDCKNLTGLSKQFYKPSVVQYLACHHIGLTKKDIQCKERLMECVLLKNLYLEYKNAVNICINEKLQEIILFLNY